MKSKMTARRRSERLDELVDLFRWGDGTYHVLGEGHFSTRAEAEAAWPRARRLVWAETHRFMLPSAAESFDGLQHSALEYLRSYWLFGFDADEALARLAEDRERVEAFRASNPDGAATISDYLRKLADDYDAVEGTIRALAIASERTYPHHLASAAVYGAPSDPDAAA
jgi:hypothetical protein